jgi:hypothetical protein
MSNKIYALTKTRKESKAPFSEEYKITIGYYFDRRKADLERNRLQAAVELIGEITFIEFEVDELGVINE